MAAEPPFSRIAIAGLGLIGGSIAQAIRQTWPNVEILGMDRAAAAEARTRGLVDEECAATHQLRGADLLVIATPVPQIVDVIQQVSRDSFEGIVTDVGSTKRQIMNAARETRLTFVGGHPVAGSEQGGLDHARADLFSGRPWLLVQDSAPEPAIARVESFVQGLGAMPKRIGAEQHDRVMAYVSHLPQLVSSVLMRTAGLAVGSEGLDISGRGFADMTRLASSPPDLWRGILSSNADFVSEAVQAFVNSLPGTAAELEGGPGVQDILREAKQLTER